MPSISKRTEPPARSAPERGEVGVLMCMALVVAAVVVGLHLQMGVPLAIAALAGTSMFVGLVGFHAWRHGEAERKALSSELRRLEAELERGMVAGSGALHQTEVTSPGAERVAARIAAAKAGTASQQPQDFDIANAPIAEAPQFEAYAGAPAVAPGESFSDYWQAAEAAYSASSSASPARAPDAPARAVSAAEDEPRREGPANGSSVREDDVEMLQRRIKEMLYQVTAAEQARELGAAAPALAHDAEAASAGMEASLDALHAAVHSMRKPTGVVSSSVTPFEDRAPVAPVDPHLVAVREAIAAGRVDVFLEPILGLSNQTAQHYEVSVKLRGPHTEDLGTGEGEVLAGRGLLPLFDAVRIERSAIVAERLAGRGKGGAVFSRTSGEALIEPEFTRSMQMDFVARPATARQLILTFSQADIRSFRAAEQRAVSALSALGFRFAISALTDLDMNFGAMANAGFGFVKLDASVLTEGLPHPGGLIPADDVCRFLADQGFGLIVEGIDSEETLARVFGFGVLMGQGALFGGPRPVKADVAARRGQAA